MDLKGKKVLVAGLGSSGESAALLCAREGALVTAADRSPNPPAAARLAQAGIALSLGGHREEDFAAAGIIVLSPGVDHRLPEIQRARQRGAEVMGEMELGWRFLAIPAVMITGTNGKSTVTTLIGDMMRAAGREILLGGNLGVPLTRFILDGGKADWAVLEVSSFQTDTAPGLKPRVGVILNITPDHMDRYADLEEYARSKYRLLANQEGEDVAVLCAEDPEVWGRRGLAPARVWGYGLEGPLAPGGWQKDGILVLDTGDGQLRLEAANPRMSGGFNRLNILAACLAGLAAGLPAEAMTRAVREYKALGHRLALVASQDGVDWYDDSKGTNVGAVEAALGAVPGPVILLLGGRDKEGRFAALAGKLREKVDLVICFGEAGPVIEPQVAPFARTVLVPGLAEAVETARREAGSGTAVLLSPGCASFDAYTGYAARGDHFQALVKEGLHG